MNEIIAFRRFVKLPEQAVKAVHSSFVPAEVYNSDPIKAHITFREVGIDFERELPVYRLSPLGVEIDIGTDLPQRVTDRIRPGLELDLKLRIGNDLCDFSGMVVATRHREGTKDLFGVRWCHQAVPAADQSDRRKHRRWLCGEEFLPTGIAANPVRFNDFIYFKLIDISNQGVLLSTSLRNKFLIPGIQFETMCSFPLIGQLAMVLKIRHARIRAIDGKDFLVLGATIVDPSHRTNEILGQYLLQFASETPDAEILKQHGYKFRSVASALIFGFVKTAQDYRDVLNLRHSAYAAVGKVDKQLLAESVGDIYDTRARIITARHGETLVGSFRLIYHEPNDKFEHEQFVAFPEHFPRKDEMVEATRVCTHMSYRGADLFYALIKQMMMSSIQSKRFWILGSATKKLIPLYEKVGFARTGVRFSHVDLGNEEHEILLANVPQIIAGVGVGPNLWNALYSDVAEHLSELHNLEFDPIANLRMAAYRALAPISRFLTRGIRNPRRNKG